MAKEITEISDDLILGVKEISKFLGQPEGPTYHLIATGRLEGVFKIAPRRHAGTPHFAASWPLL
jgi:hypothetical protein